MDFGPFGDFGAEDTGVEEDSGGLSGAGEANWRVGDPDSAPIGGGSLSTLFAFCLSLVGLFSVSVSGVVASGGAGEWRTGIKMALF